jgi:hypothetical protein
MLTVSKAVETLSINNMIVTLSVTFCLAHSPLNNPLSTDRYLHRSKIVCSILNQESLINRRYKQDPLAGAVPVC